MIFYFSGTGNTQWAVRELAKSTCEKTVVIPDVMDSDCHFVLAEGERIGFCFPVHGWRPPILVRKFISKLTIDNVGNHYCYALCTAGDNIGETIDLLQYDLSDIGLKADSAFTLIMPESYVGLPFMDVDKPAREKEKKDKAEKDLSEYTKYIVNREKGIFKLVLGNWPKINSRVLGGYFLSHLITDKPFHVVSERCVKCGICANACPVNDINGGLGQEPEWKHNGSCLTCFACYHHCPHHAIEFGNRTKNKGQYWFNKSKLK